VSFRVADLQLRAVRIDLDQTKGRTPRPTAKRDGPTRLLPTNARSVGQRALTEKIALMRELLLGLTIGFSAGVSPGPLLALVVTTSLRHGRWAGLQVAASPLVTDLPIIILTLTVLNAVPGRVVAAVGTVGAVVVLKLGTSALRQARRAKLPAAENGATTHPLAKACWLTCSVHTRGCSG
jgi:LysE type translocator